MTSAKDEQRERREVLRNDQRIRGATFHQFGIADSESVGGRYVAQTRSTVTAAEPVAYPAQPENSPWHRDPVPAEAPLGYSINEPPIVGEPFEVEKSLAEASDNIGIHPLPDVDASLGGGDDSAARASPPPSNRNKKSRNVPQA